jgi:ATP-dependent Clp protease ATP-binding subunit ClpC
MFNRFTDRARRVVVLAQHEARTFGHDFIGTEHILLGLIDEGQGVAARALASMGVSLDEMQQAVQDTVGRGAEPPPESGHIPFTPRAKKVLELSLREAQQLGDTYIGTEHILLAVIREGGAGAQLLAGAGVDLDRARRQVLEVLHGHREAGVAAAPPPPPAAADELMGRLTSILTRLDAIEQRLGQSSPG